MSFLFVILFVIADVMVSIWFGKVVGGWMLLLWFVIAIVLGRQIMKGATKVLMPQFKDAQQGQNIDPNTDFLAALCQALAGFLFIIPSVMTDAIAVLLLLPPVQKALQGKMQTAFAARGSSFMKMGGMGRFGQGQSPFEQPSPFDGANHHQGQVIDGEAVEVEPQVKMRVTTREENAPKPKAATTTEVKSNMKVTTRVDKPNS